ncbi:efflux RND transporter periplasmic adaptor subunit [Geminicoccus roseus]|uniref:efflux RND transporter periplasmic adaptor subunit n=1 Tax=Geminicoccus roseus TaxID=404900 RepID=UPI0003FDFC48|nr:efflux RND transporter periplasmic adaptor subunit [Geminicoccus roseus]
MLRNIVAILVVLLIAAGAGGAYWWFVMRPQMAAQGGGGGPPAGFAMPVEAAEVKIAPAATTTDAVGSLRSTESVLLKPEVSGRIVNINFDEGQRVRKGTVLIELDRSIEEAELEQARAELELAQSEYERQQTLRERNNVSQAALDQAKARLATATAEIALAEARLAKRTLLAPFDARAGLRRVSPGAFVETGTPLVNLEDIDPLKLDFRVPERFLPTVQIGQAIEVQVDAFPNQEFQGEVAAIDPQIDEAGRSLVVRAVVQNEDDRLRPGLFARVTLTLASREDAIWIDEAAIVPMGDQATVFKLVEDGEGKTTAKSQPVRLGLRQPGLVEVVEGLEAGDRVVTAGVLKIGDGSPVQVVPSPGEGQASPPAGEAGAEQEPAAAAG